MAKEDLGGVGVRHLKSSLAAAQTGLQAVLIARSALEGFEGVSEAVAEHRHLAAMAHRARDKGKAPTALARVGLLHPLGKHINSQAAGWSGD